MIYVSTLSHFRFSFLLSLSADSIMGQVSPEGLLSRLQIEGANTEAESEVGHLGIYDHLFSEFVKLFSEFVKLDCGFKKMIFLGNKCTGKRRKHLLLP